MLKNKNTALPHLYFVLNIQIQPHRPPHLYFVLKVKMHLDPSVNLYLLGLILTCYGLVETIFKINLWTTYYYVIYSYSKFQTFLTSFILNCAFVHFWDLSFHLFILVSWVALLPEFYIHNSGC